MTATEQISSWAEVSSDILVSVTYEDKPCEFGQVKAEDALIGFARHAASINVARVAELKGVTCVVVEGRIPEPGGAYRAVLSPAENFK